MSLGYSEGSGKAMLAIFIAIILVVVAVYWQNVLFILKAIWDLIVLNLQPLLQKIPFLHSS